MNDMNSTEALSVNFVTTRTGVKVHAIPAQDGQGMTRQTLCGVRAVTMRAMSVEDARKQTNICGTCAGYGIVAEALKPEPATPDVIRNADGTWTMYV